MKRIVILTPTLAADDKWWGSQTKEFQKKYIKDHPSSKYAKNAKKSIEKLSSGKKPVNNGKKTLTGPDSPKTTLTDAVKKIGDTTIGGKTLSPIKLKRLLTSSENLNDFLKAVKEVGNPTKEEKENFTKIYKELDSIRAANLKKKKDAVKTTKMPKSVCGRDIKFKSSSDRKRAIEQITKDIKDASNRLNNAKTPKGKKQASEDLEYLNGDLARMKAGFDPFAEGDEKYNQDIPKKKAEKEAEKKLKKDAKELVNNVKVKPAVPGTQKYADTASRLKNAAQDGDRIVINGKTVWAGLGNRSGLHSYAQTVLNEKWNKSGARFMKNLDELLSPGAIVEVQMFRNIDRDRGKWVTQTKVKLNEK